MHREEGGRKHALARPQIQPSMEEKKEREREETWKKHAQAGQVLSTVRKETDLASMTRSLYRNAEKK